jgi:Tol biopolymer transport system component
MVVRIAILLCLAACHRASPDAAPTPERGLVLLHEDGVENAYPRLSRDGKELLYQSNRGGHWDIYVLDRATGTSRALTTGGANNNLPDWSATQLAFVSDRDGNEEIYLADRDGGNARRLTNSPGRDIHPYFSLDGKTLFYNSDRSGSLDVVSRDLVSGEEHIVSATPDEETCARLSPDGKRIVLLRNNASSDDIWTVDLASGSANNVTNTPAVRDGWPTWSPDGTWIYFGSIASGRFAIDRVRADGARPQQLTAPEEAEEDARPFVSSDGKLLVFNRRSKDAIDIVTLSLR